MSKKNIEPQDVPISDLGYELEEAFIQVLQKYGDTANVTVAVGALGLATGHILQTLEKSIGYEIALTDLFDEMREAAYKHFKENPTDTADYPGFQMPIGKC